MSKYSLKEIWTTSVFTAMLYMVDAMYREGMEDEIPRACREATADKDLGTAIRVCEKYIDMANRRAEDGRH